MLLGLRSLWEGGTPPPPIVVEQPNLRGARPPRDTRTFAEQQKQEDEELIAVIRTIL